LLATLPKTPGAILRRKGHFRHLRHPMENSLKIPMGYMAMHGQQLAIDECIQV